MARPDLIALTGTPGVGKTSLGSLLSADGRRVIGVGDWAKAHGCIAGRDDADDADVIDVDALAEHLPDPPAVLDGHLAHLLPVDEVWLIRVDPEVLRGRLDARGYAPAKVMENLEAEAMDLILQEALDGDARVIQRDGTRRTPEQLMSAFVEASSGSMKDHDLEPVDWSHRLPLR